MILVLGRVMLNKKRGLAESDPRFLVIDLRGNSLVFVVECFRNWILTNPNS